MQISQVFSQRTWPAVGDIDDCWVVSAIQCAHAVAPWMPLPTNTEFRRAAGDPDDGIRDGGSADQSELVRGVRGCFPGLEVTPVVNGSWLGFRFDLGQGRVASVAVASAKLPARLRFGFTGAHQVSLAYVLPERFLFIANPLAPDRSPWIRTTWVELEPAVFGYAGQGKVSGVLFPTEAEALATHPLLAGVTAAARRAVASEAAAIARQAVDRISAIGA